MPRLLPLVAGLMLALAGWTGVAHAAEAAAPIVGAELLFHAAGDADQVPADADLPFPHHHGGCHGHDVGPPAEAGAMPLAAAAAPPCFVATAPVPASAEPDLRPRPPRP